MRASRRPARTAAGPLLLLLLRRRWRRRDLHEAAEVVEVRVLPLCRQRRAVVVVGAAVLRASARDSLTSEECRQPAFGCSIAGAFLVQFVWAREQDGAKY